MKAISRTNFFLNLQDSLKFHTKIDMKLYVFPLPFFPPPSFSLEIVMTSISQDAKHSRNTCSWLFWNNHLWSYQCSHFWTIENTMHNPKDVLMSDLMQILVHYIVCFWIFSDLEETRTIFSSPCWEQHKIEILAFGK